MKDPHKHCRCQSCGARVRSGFLHRVGVAVANPAMKMAVRLVEVLTCSSRYCVSRKNQIAAQM